MLLDDDGRFYKKDDGTWTNRNWHAEKNGYAIPFMSAFIWFFTTHSEHDLNNYLEYWGSTMMKYKFTTSIIRKAHKNAKAKCKGPR